jgi:hypothetical protein
MPNEFRMKMKLDGFLRFCEYIMETKDQIKAGETYRIIGAEEEHLVIELLPENTSMSFLKKLRRAISISWFILTKE